MRNNSLQKFKLMILSFLLISTSGSLWSQVSITTNVKANNASSIHVCDTGHTFNLNFGVASTISGGTLNITMPSGCEYEPGSITVTSGSVTIGAPTGPANDPTFSLGSITGPASISIKYKVKASCEAFASVIAGTNIHNDVTITPTGGTATTNSTPVYNISHGTLNWVSISNSPFTGNVGSTFSRLAKITNSGNGTISKFYLDTKLGSGIRLDSVTLAPGISVPVTTIGDSSVVFIDLASYTATELSAIAAFSNANGGIMNTDTMFYKNTTSEVLVLTYYHTVLACTDNEVDYIGHYGCNVSGNCKNGTEASQKASVVINTGGPDVRAISLSVVGDTSTFRAPTVCGKGKASAMWINQGTGGGAGFAKDFEPCPAYNNFYYLWQVDTIQGNFHNARIFKNGTSVPLQVVRTSSLSSSGYYRGMTNGYWKVPANTLTSDPDGPGGFSDLDGDGFYDDLAVGDTVKLTWDISSVENPTDYKSCSPDISRFAISATSRFSTQCGTLASSGGALPGVASNAQSLRGIFGSFNIYDSRALSYSDAVARATGPTDISPGQTLTYKFTIPNYYDRYGTFNLCDTNRTRLILIVPTGFTVASATFVGEFFFNTIYTSGSTGSATITTSGDTIFIDAPLNVNALGTFEVPITFTCITDIANVNIPFSFQNICMMNGCETAISAGCGDLKIRAHDCAPPCPNGIATKNGSAARTSFGYTDATYTTKVTASTPGVRADRIVTGDTINVKSSGYMTTGASYSNGHFKVVYKSPSTRQVFAHAGGTITFYDVSAGTSASVALPTPAFSSSGGEGTMDYDYSSLLGTGGVQATLDDGDSIVIDADWQMVDSESSALLGLSHYTMDKFEMRFWVDSFGVEKACDWYNSYLELWTNVITGFWSGSTTSNIIGCGNIPSAFWVGDNNQWVSQDFFENERRPYYKVDTFIFTLPVELELASTSFSYTGQSATSLWKVGNKVYATRTGGFIVDDNKVGSTIDFLLKNSCKLEGELLYDIEFKGIAYRGNKEVNISTIGDASRPYSPNHTKAELNIQPIGSTFVGNTSPASWDVQLCNQNNFTAGKPWVAFELPAGVTAVSIEDVTSGTAVPMTMKAYGSGKVFAQFAGDLTGLDCRTARLKATYSTCNIDTIKAITGFDCDTLVGNPDLSACTKWPTDLVLKPAVTSFQLNKLAEPTVPQQLCSDTLIELEVLNVNNATADDLKLQIVLPPGIDIVTNSSQASYVFQSSGSYLTVSDPTAIGGGVFEYNLSTEAAFSSTLGTDGLVGALSTPNNLFKIKFLIRTSSTCEFVSGSQLKYRMTGKNPCGSDALAYTATSNIYVINGAPANPNAYGISSTITDTVLKPCQTPGTNVLRVKVAAFGPAATGSNETFRITLPVGVTFNTGSYSSVHNSLGAPTVSTVSGKEVLDWNLTSGTAVGDSFVFDITVTPSSSLVCGSVDIDMRTLVSFSTTCVTTSTTCSLNSITGTLVKTVDVEKPIFTIDKFTASSVPNGSSGETITADIEVSNSGADRTTDYYVKIYNDANLNGMVDGSDILLDSILIASPHNSATMKTAMKTFSVTSGRACPLIASIDDGDCVCSGTSKLLADVPLANVKNDTTLCAGSSAVIGNSPIVGYTYLWNPSSDLSSSSVGNPTYTAVNTTNSPITTEYVLSTIRGGCTSSDTVTVTADAVPQGLDIAADNTCINSATTLTASSTSPGVTYSWKVDGVAAGTGTSITPTLTAGSHSIEVTAELANGCTAVYTESITFYALNIGVTTGTPPAVCEGGAMNLTASTSNATIYRWYKVGTPGVLGYAPSQSTGALSDTTTFRVVAENGTCIDSAEAKIDVIKAKFEAEKDDTICPGGTTTLSVPVSYNTANWTDLTSGGSVSGVSYNFSPSVTTDYRVVATTLTPACSSVDTVTVTVRAVTAPVISGDRNVCSGGSAAYTAAPTGTSPMWTASAGTITSAGAYTAPSVTSTTNATITYTQVDGNSCSVMDTHNIVIDPLPIVNITSSNTSMCPSETRTLAGTPAGGTFSGTGVSGTTFTGPTTPGNYVITYTATNANGCTNSTTQTITIGNPVSMGAISFSSSAVCVGSTTTAIGSPAGGTWSVVSGPGTINASSGQLTTTGAGMITVKYDHPGITGSSCPNSVTSTITPVPNPTVAPTTGTTPVCNGSSTPVAANATGGTGTLNYSWSPSGTGASFTATPSGNTNYSVTVTDANSCTATGSVTVNVTGTSPLTANPGNARTVCSGTATTLGGAPTGSGGDASAAYTYAWSNGAGTTPNPSVSPTTTTTYTVTVTNSSCTATNTVTVNVNAKPSVTPSASVSSVCSGSNTTLSAAASGGVSPYTYQWNTSQTSQSFVASPTATGSPLTTAYTVTVTDANTCTVSETVNVTVNPLPIVPSMSPVNACLPASGGSVDIVAGALTGSQTGAWSTVTSPTGAVTFTPTTSATSSASILQPTNNYVFKWTITENGCSSSANLTVSVNELPVLNAGIDDTICSGESSNLVGTINSISPTLVNWKLNSLTSSPIANTAAHTVTPEKGSIYIFTGSIGSCIAYDTVKVPVRFKQPDSAVTTLEGVTVNNGGPVKVVPGTDTTIAITPPTNGTVVVNPDGSVTYTPNPTFVGNDTIIREVCRYDSVTLTTLCDTSVFTFIVIPKANDSTITIPEGGTATIGDTIPKVPGATPTITKDGPENGTATVNPDGTVTYTPNPGFVGKDTVTRIVCWYHNASTMLTDCDTSELIFHVLPKSTPDSATTLVGRPVTGGKPIPTIPGVRVDIDTIGPTNGKIVVNPDGTIIYTPDSGFVGIDTVTRIVCQFDTATTTTICDTALIIFKVLPKDPDTVTITTTDKPVTAGEPVEKVPGTSTTVTTKDPDNGTITKNPDGSVTYTPDPGFVGVDTVTRIVCRYDSSTMETFCDTSEIIFKVFPNHPDDTVKTKEGVEVTGGSKIPKFPGTLTTITKTGPDNGTATVNPDGTVTYKPNPGFIGTDSVVRTVCVYDSATMLTVCDTSVVYFIVEPTNKTNPDVNVTYVDKPVTGNVSTNDKVAPGTTYGDPVGDGNNPTTEVPTINPDGTYTFTGSQPGVYVFTVPVCAPGQTTGCPTETLTITVLDDKNANPPIANTDVTISKGNPVTLNTLSNDKPGTSGASLDPSSVKIVEDPKNGTATVDPATGNVTYTPNPGFVGKDTLKYIVCDDATPPACAEAYQIITVLDPNSPNVTSASDDYGSGEGVITGNVLDNDSDPEGNNQTVTPQDVTIPGKGRLVLAADGSYTFTPEKGFTGPLEVVYQVCDDGTPTACDNATLHLLVEESLATEIPNYFSPNADGSNDAWVIPTSVRTRTTAIVIYNRWGNIVWRKEGVYENDFLGEHFDNNNPLPDGVYYYQLELKDEDEPVSGFIEIMRK